MAYAKDPQRLSEIALFHGLTSDQLVWLSERLYQTKAKSSASIVLANQPGEVIYIIQSGAVKVHIERLNGTNIILAILGPGNVIGEMSLVDSIGRSASITALEPTTLLWLNRDDFEQCLLIMPLVAQNLNTIFSVRLRLANEQIQALATLDIYGRIARQILALASEYGAVNTRDKIIIPFRLTQSDWADLVGASRERVNQAFGHFKRLKLITVDRRHRITVLDQQSLQRQCL